MELPKIRKAMAITQKAFGELVGTDGRNIRRYEAGYPVPWILQSRADRLTVDRFHIAKDAAGNTFIHRNEPPGLIAEVKKRGVGHSLTIVAWLDKPPKGEKLDEAVRELREFWIRESRDADR